MRAAPAEKQAAGHDSQHPRGVNGIRREIDRVRDQNTESDLDGTVVNLPLDIIDNPTNEQAECDAANYEPYKCEGAAEYGGHAPAHHYSYGKLESQQAPFS